MILVCLNREAVDATTNLPALFEGLYFEEENIIKKSIEQIINNVSLKDQLDMLEESGKLIITFISNYKANDDKELTYQIIGSRMFNSVVVSFKLLLSGYYQHSASIIRDVLESMYLLDYFSLYPEKVQEWKKCDEKKQKKEFSQVNIRTALDERDKLSNMKRLERYKLLCKIGTHPSYEGLMLIAPNNNVIAGPFFHADYLKASLEETVQISTEAAIIFIELFKNQHPNIIKKVSCFFEKYKAWLLQYHGIELPSIDNDIHSL